MYNPRNRGRTSHLALMMLFGQMAQVGFDKIPPVTLASIATQVAIFLQLFDVPWIRSGLENVCISALHVWYRDDWKRLLLATFFHADEWHLYYNMVSMLWKGIKLEKKLGSIYFFSLLTIFSILVNVILVALAMAADYVTHDHSYITQCAVGFSGVLFALKVVLTDAEPTAVHYVMGIPVPSKLVCWAELGLIHIMVPNASFLGHLSGIIAGLLYVKGPLKIIMRFLSSIFTETGSRNRRDWGTGVAGTRRHQATDTTGGSDFRAYTGVAGARRNQPTDTTGGSDFQPYTGGMSEEEQMNRALRNSVTQGSRNGEGTRPGRLDTGPDSIPDLDDIRKRRLNRFTSS